MASYLYTCVSCLGRFALPGKDDHEPVVPDDFDHLCEDCREERRSVAQKTAEAVREVINKAKPRPKLAEIAQKATETKVRPRARTHR